MDSVIMNVGNPINPQESIMEKIVKEYDAKIDSKKRLTIRGTEYDYFHIKHYKNGSILLEPRVLVEPKISKETLEMIEESVDNYREGKISKPVDVSKYKG